MGKGSAIFRLAKAVLPGSLVIVLLVLTSLHSYLLFHSIVELFSIIVAAGIFMIAWNARGYLNNNYLLFVGIASIFVAILDLMHTLAYQGMGVFNGQTADLSTQLWIAGRYLQSISLLIAPFFLGRHLKIQIQILTYTILTSLLFGSIFYWHVFPAAFLTGIGLTPFKIISEYVISSFFLISIFLLLQKREEFDPGILRLLVISIVFTIGSELAFTTYISVYGPSNMVGHILRLIAFYFLYKAIIETGLVQPYALLLRNLRRSEDELREKAAALQTRNEELDAFAHTVAHDLKNPLTVIISAADIILHNIGLPKEELKEFAEEVKDTAYDMNDIVTSLLLLSEVRKVEAPVELVDMDRIVAKVLDRLHYKIEESRAQISLPPGWPDVMGYAPWIGEVWINYISNALKYGGQPPHVELGASIQTDNTVRFWVRDDGPGLTPEAQARLFVPFTQLKQIQTEGHGLGLSIVQRIIEKLGGQVGLESGPGKGSLFFFTLPGPPAKKSRSNNLVKLAQDEPVI